MRKRILAVLGMLLVFRILAHIPVPLSDPQTLRQVLENLYTQTGANQLLGFLNVLSGGALANFSIMLVGLGPYINASIIMQLLTKAVPKFEALNKEGEFGRRKINQYTRMLTFPLAIIQSIGNGISLLITVGIVSALPSIIYQLAIGTTFDPTGSPADKLTLFNHAFSKHGLILIGAIALATVLMTWTVVKLNEASRKLTVNYAKRVQGNRTYGGVTTTLPVKLIAAGVIPIIFAVAFLSVPGFLGQILTRGQGIALIAQSGSEKFGVLLSELFQNPTAATFGAGGWKPWVYPATYFFFVFIFTYFYTSVTFNSKEIAENLQKQGGFLAGIRSGKQTEKYLSKTITRLTFFGAIALGLLAVLPIVASRWIDPNIALGIGGTSILILVSVSLETLRQVESRAMMITYDQYEQPDYFYEPGPGGTAAMGARRLRFIRRPKRRRK